MKETNRKLLCSINLKLILIFVFLNVSCSSIEDCFSSAGKTVQKTFSFDNYNKIRVMPGMALVVKQGSPSIVVEAGENLIDEVKLSKQGDFLVIENSVSCNYSRDNKVATVYVATNNLEEIHSKTEQDIKSEGVLAFPVLRLFNIKDNFGNGTGDFYINIDNNQLVFEVNSTTNFNISGKTDLFVIGNYNGDSRINATNLESKSIDLFYRGSNDAFLRPINEIKGQILSVGNVYIYNSPPIINVSQPYVGRLIIQ